ncbi:glyoxalase/bleomycin resistance protein/dioxygenase family protein (plasmid) [Rhizobium phaseoli]|uniref:VOC family protein n=1 Tax=Rhizobium phaseoli TaxID=396 RepID=UPI0007E966A7|nr:VOC family protein [Rhizobium phaseoli]ANL69793.1 glyoxalase/bleomycin resistance protein/dioxygenase family protein [Rhizobium phaseoli]ANL76230.1 glyoxalase/bleomycin resistance protein/dioxygenase family protein [Rhizobium phaseoli]ANL82587.1 glyoxalase/bleomycin resistance protein/dioxygenase family protein [Rhizobium phaseoli]PDS68168.1 VOC family protein [Rhizobium phaseoli]
MTLRVGRLGHIGIAVRDMERSVRFYTEVLGMRLTEQFNYGLDEVGHGVAVLAGSFVRNDATHHCLSIFTLRSAIEPPPQHCFGLHHIAFEMNSSDDLLALYKRFEERGHPIVNARKGGPGNQPRFYGRDPDGNLLEFYWGIDQIGWDGIARPYPPIEEIELETFDFQAFEDDRERMAEQARNGLGTDVRG